MVLIIEKWRSSPMVRVPEFGMKKFGLGANDVIDIKDQYGCIIIGHTELKMYSLDTLLEGISAVNLHPKIGFGLPTGKEQL
ncbi:AbrB/MazE/SpoVT family DNA-binding domain-containing protein [Yersinia enterocolitica]|nr:MULTISPECIES: hypothetical protein [Enterobacterales]KLV80686.1 hypothetical protein SK39_01994 [Citrobacter sp. BIDMC107]AMA04958.1 hypothetical protein ACJ69_15515 [Enterobacter asburiae]MDD9242746.1 hypothetical protein [Enterobacter soli]MDN4238646.1 hypothetical protein [Citrobacter freundii]MDN4320822.1 hypothetical protein [Citrobacter freundii]